ncbi:MAG: helix-turn-helix domain-containing protein [Candidatus Peregrinibacteria bacterium]
MVDEFLKKLGLDAKDSKILMSVLKLGSQPASIIAQHANLDRTTTYRILNELYKKRLLSRSKRKGVTVFYLEKLSDIERYIKSERSRYENLAEEFQALSPQLELLRSSMQELPRIQIYDGFEKLQDFYRDIIHRAKEQKLIQIRILGSNTFSQKLERKELGDTIGEFERELRENGIEGDILIAQGHLTREWISHLPSFRDMANLPAAGGATNVILVGDSVFMVSFRDFPVGIRIDHPDIAQTMHFLFDVTRRELR